MENLQELQNKLEEIKRNLNQEQQEFFSLKSLQNFLNQYPKLTYYKESVQKLFIEYFPTMEYYNYKIDKETSTKIGIEYIMKIGYYYTGQLDFKLKMKLDFAIFWGVAVDLLLLILGVLHKVYYIPVATGIMLIYWGYLKIFFEKKNKIYAIGY
ncbi:MAG: hypothetical protein ABI359_09060 [Ginsengibacter sp.]